MNNKLVHLINLLTRAYRTQSSPSKPFIIALTGGVAVGKTYLADTLKNSLRKNIHSVHTLCTDGFLLSNSELARRGLESRKGFPESYDTAAMLHFLATIRAGNPAAVPLYNHELYDIIPDQTHTVVPADILIIEGLNILNLAQTHPEKKLFDTIIYIDADETDNKKWFLKRVHELRAQAAHNPASFYRQFVHLPEIVFTVGACRVWKSVNKKNFEENVLPFKKYADIIIRKKCDHTIESIIMHNSPATVQ